MAARSRESRKEEERERKLNEIKETALILFSTKGYAGTTIEDIAHEVGYGKASLYYYFANKEAIVKSLIYDAMDVATKRMDEIFDETKTPVESLSDLFSYYVDDYSDRHGFFNIYYLVGHFMQSILNEDEGREMQIRMAQMRTRIIGLIKKGIDQEQFVDQDPEVLSEMLLGMISGLMQQMRNPNMKHLSKQTVKETIIHMLLRSVTK